MKIFISHANEDKATVARPLAHALHELGYDVWFDEFTLNLGDSLRRSIDKGLLECDYGVVVLSPSFFAKDWPQKELDALTAKELAGKTKIILPVWHQIDSKSIAAKSPMLADRLGVSTTLGIARVVVSIREVLGAPGAQEKPTYSSFLQWSTAKWIKTQRILFPGSIPVSCAWTRLDDIVRVLSAFSIPDVNHMYLPDGGGMDMIGAGAALKEGCLEVHIDRRSVWFMKPKELQFESFAPYYSMSCLRLETHDIQPTGLYEGLPFAHEELVEIEPLHYVQRHVWDEDGAYDEEGNFIKLSEDARLVTRWFDGVFLVANKGSMFYHLDGEFDPYSGRYGKMGRSEFRKFMQDLINAAVKKNVLDE